MNAHAAISPACANGRQLRIVSSTQTGDPEATSARLTPALAVWPLEQTSSCALPAELARRLIAHYSDPGQLVLAASGANAAAAQARRLGRRALPFNGKGRACAQTNSAREAVIPLRPREPADLAIVALHTADTERLADQCARLGAELKADGFLILALARDTPAQLGAVVHACQRHRLRYWQHIVAINPTVQQAEPAGEQRIPKRARDTVRCHRDLLVFRRPSDDAIAVTREAVALAECAA